MARTLNILWFKTFMLLCLLLLGTIGGAGAQSLTNPVYDSNTTSDFAATRSSVTAGSVLVNGLTDVQGGVYTTGSGNLTGTVEGTPGTAYLRDFLIRPASENQVNSRVIVNAAPGGANVNGSVGAVLRYQTSSKNYYMATFSYIAAANTTVTFFKVVAGTATSLGSGTLSYNSAHTYQIDFSATGTGTTSLSTTLTDVTASTSVTATTTDTEASLQNAGAAGEVVWNTAMVTLRMQTFSAAATVTTVFPTDANWYASPYTWAGGFTNCTGAYRYLNFTTTASGNVLLNLNTTSIGTIRPYVSWSVDGGPLTVTQVTDANLTGTAPAQSLSLQTGLAAGTHTLYLVVRSQQSTDSTLWASGTVVISSTLGLSLPAGSTTSSWAAKSVSVLCFGDSITEGEGTEGLASANYPLNSDATHAWGYYVASALGAEYGNVGSGGQSYTGTGVNGYPAFNTSWSSVNSTISRLTAGKFSPVPNYVVVNEGTNAAPASADVAAMMTNMHGAGGAATKNIFLIPFGQYGKSNILAGLASYGGSYTALAIPNGSTVYTAASDANTWVIDLGIIASTGLTLYNARAATQQAAEGVHPFATVQAQEAALIVRAIQSALPAANALTLFITHNGSSQPVLNWLADPVTNGYKVMRSVDGINYTVIANVPAGTLTYTDTARPANATVYYNIISIH